MVNWEKLSYRDLQQACKAAGIPAKGKAAELIARLQELDGQPVAPATAATPRTVRSSRKRTLEAEGVGDTAKVSGVMTEVLAVAAEVALPAAEAEEDEGQQQEQQQPDAEPTAEPDETAYTPVPLHVASKAPGSEHLLAALKTPLPGTPPTEDLQSPAAKALKVPRKARRGGTAWLSLGRLLVVAVLCFGVAGLALPAYRQHGCHAALHQRFPGPMQQLDRLTGAAHGVALQLGRRAQAVVPDSLTDGAARYYAVGHAAVEHHYQAAQRYCTYLWHTAQQWVAETLQSAPLAPAAELEQEAAPPAAPSCSGLLNTEALANIVPTGETWENLRQTAVAAFGGQRVDPTKATAMLFACVEANCPSINQWLAWAAPEECRLWLEAGSLAEGRGALQKALATFLSQQPNGTVLLTNIHELSPELVAVLINALSEQGAFEQDGRAVRTGGATFLLTMQMPQEILSAESEAAFKVNAKAQLVQSLSQHASRPEDALTQAKALRRRIEYVLPTLI